MIHSIGTAKNGVQVRVDLIKSPAATRIARQPQLLSLVREVIAQERLMNEEARLEYDMGRPIGYDTIVAAGAGKTIFYARIVQDPVVTRFIKDAKPTPTNRIAIVLRRVTKQVYELHDVRIGRFAPPRPGAADETAESRPYWLAHAVVQEGQALQAQTITKECPY